MSWRLCMGTCHPAKSWTSTAIARIDVFVNASVTEGGSPVAVQEAVSCSIPIIATDAGGNGEIVLDVMKSLVAAGTRHH